MAASSRYGSLNAAIDTTPIVDNHAHPLLKLENANQQSLLAISTEASGAALGDTPQSLSHIRTVKHLAQVLGCSPTWESVTNSIERRRETPALYNSWIERCLEGIETILVDDGLHMDNEAELYSWHDQFTKSKCKRIVRIEVVAENIIARHCTYVTTSKGAAHFDDFVDEFQEEIRKAIADPEVVGFKSIICYRGGLDIPAKSSFDWIGPQKALEKIIDDHLSGARPFNLNKRLESLPLNHLLLYLTAELIVKDTADHKKPIQFHTGLGDNDILLTKSSPSHLQTFIREYPSLPIVILHASWPWTREASYLATVYKNVYLDIGEVFPMISRYGQEQVVKQSLELSPWSKILWSTDGHWLPETYVLATMQIRSVLKTVLNELVQAQQLSEEQAVQLVQAILFTNSQKLYNLTLTSTLPPYTQLSSSPPPSTALLPPTPSGPDVLNKLLALGTQYLRIYWHDYTSSARCRVLPLQQVASALQSSAPLRISITKACLALLQNDTLIPQASPSGVYALVPDFASLRAGPAPGHASCYGAFRDARSGAAEPLCPRTLLRGVISRAAGQGLSFLLGFEIEFVVLERGRGDLGKYAPLRSDGHAWSGARAVAWDAAEEVLARLREAGVEVQQFHAESAPGQYEVVLGPLGPLAACDALLHARQVLESCAAGRGYRVTLHPKPFAGVCGSASHVHMSVSSSSSGTAPESVYEPFYAGILSHLRALAAFTYSNPASYERVADGVWAGGRWVAWGTQNRETPLRKVEDSHWEVKALDGIANPYLAVAALLAAGADGVRRGADLGMWGDCVDDPALLSPERRKELGIEKMLPADLGEALKALQEDKELVELLGAEFVQRYVDVKTAEIALLSPMSAEVRREWILERY
ncbi:hypothetical protein F4810DRAFT_88841 [Camillea tinctor]|nr:hypothetical protein F4810DRAFT_88841 [Camillea tinctor]